MARACTKHLDETSKPETRRRDLLGRDRDETRDHVPGCIADDGDEADDTNDGI